MFDGVPLIRRVYNTCASTGIDTYVLTDDERIAAVVPNSIMTSSNCNNGTERCASVADILNYEKFINVQGDMIDVTIDMIELVNEKISWYNPSDYVTLHTTMSAVDQENPNVVKMIHTDEMVHWFCRAPLQYGSRHIGIYGYHREALKKYYIFAPTQEEEIESLEQLRWIQKGGRISTYEVVFDGIEINTPEDANNWHKQRAQNNYRMSSEEKQRRYEKG
jgi:3-deoxy-manno-octulosonate cytidylyltransferase (CMP-KDO synthetase)